MTNYTFTLKNCFLKRWKKEGFFLLLITAFLTSQFFSFHLPQEIQAQATPSWVPAGWGAGGNTTVVEIDPNDKRIMWGGADIGGPFRSDDAGEHWILKTTGYDCVGVESFAITPGDSNRVFAMCEKGIYRSTDRGENWTKVSPSDYSFGLGTGTGPGWGWNRVISINPQNIQEILVGGAKSYRPSWEGGGYLNGGGLWRTTDGGNNWSHVNSLSGAGASDIDVMVVVRDPVDPRIIYVSALGSGAEMRVSRDGGVSWQGTGRYNITSIAVTTANANVVYAARQDGYIFRSADKGLTWSDKPISNSGFNLGNHKYTVLAVDRNNANNVYLGMKNGDYNQATTVNGQLVFNHGIYKSTNGGDSWTCINKKPNGTSPYIMMVNQLISTEMIAIDPDDFNTVYLATFFGMFKSSDGGNSWWMKSNGLQVSSNTRIVFDPDDQNKVYVSGGDSTMMYSDNYGASWRQVWKYYGQSYGLATSNPSTGRVLFFSNDEDNRYSAPNPNIYPTIIRRAKTADIAASNDNTDFGSLWTITQNGLPNTEMGVGSFPYRGGVIEIITHPTNTSVVYAGVKEYGIYRTTNATAPGNQVNWVRVASGYPLAFAMAPSNPNYLYSVGRNWGIRSTDGGNTWSNMDTGGFGMNGEVYEIEVDPTNPNTLYVSTQVSVVKSTDGGSSWTTFFDSKDNNGNYYIYYPFAMEIDPNNNQRFFIALDGYVPNTGKGVVMTTNGGSSWTDLSNGLSGKVSMSQLVYDSRRDTLWIGTINSLFKIQLSGSANQPPIAVATANPNSGKAPLSVNFSSSGSIDSDGSIASYSWDFGDNNTSTQANPSHTYSDFGNYSVRLTVTDNQGATGITTVSIGVGIPADINGDGIVDLNDAQVIFSDWHPSSEVSSGADLNADRRVNGMDYSRLAKDWNQSVNSSFRGSYYNNTDFSGLPALTWDDASINFDWETVRQIL